jgi:hypothetical protein
MSKDKALRLALEALEYPGPSWLEARQPAITAIKQALEQPVATNDTSKDRVDETAKQRHEPLTDEEIIELLPTGEWEIESTLELVRAIENAHGIKGQA